jgi:hypothetical protein
MVSSSIDRKLLTLLTSGIEKQRYQQGLRKLDCQKQQLAQLSEQVDTALQHLKL